MKKRAVVYTLLLAGAIGLLSTWIVHAKADPSLPKSISKDGYSVVMSISPYPAKVLKNSTFTVRLKTADGRTVTGAKLNLLLSMPKMMCGTVKVAMAEQNGSRGVYAGEGFPLMPGSWQAAIRIEADGQAATIDYPFHAEY